MLFSVLIPRSPVRRLAYALCLLILIPSLSFAAYLVSQSHTRELSDLHRSAETRALLAASFFDQQMVRLLASLKDLTVTPAAASENISDRLKTELDRKGILVFTRASNLDLLSPASGANTAIVSLDTPARAAAAAALATLAPQITPYGVGENGGVNIWLASTEKDSSPVLLQARIPSAYLASALTNFVSDGPWSISVIGNDGQIYAEAGGKSNDASKLDVVSKASFVEGFANTSAFGWKIAAGMPSRSIEVNLRRNWMTFVAISSLLAIASFTGATLLTRSLLEEVEPSNLMQASQMPSRTHRPTRTQQLSPPAGTGEEWLHPALQAGNVGVWEWNLENGLVRWDAQIAGIFDRPLTDKDRVARNLLRLVEPHDRRRLLNAIGTALADAKPLTVEVRLLRVDSEVRWVAIRGAVTSTKKQKPTTLSGVAYDVTDQKLNLSRTDALLREVSHRSKNLLALILAMARLTARDAVDVKSHLKDFTLRVAGLAASQDLIVASDWQSADLSTLASAEIGAVARTDADRIAISGPPVLLTPEAAQTFGMVLTELALNAVEHGALSSATGGVHLSWTLPDDDTIAITWQETGGPAFSIDGPKGYGRSVVERFSTQGLKLTVHAATDREGFKWTLTGPLANIGSRAVGKA